MLAFFLGEQPRTIDATVYAFATSVIHAPIDGPIRDAAAGRENLVAYCDRVRASYWMDS